MISVVCVDVVVEEIRRVGSGFGVEVWFILEVFGGRWMESVEVVMVRRTEAPVCV